MICTLVGHLLSLGFLIRLDQIRALSALDLFGGIVKVIQVVVMRMVLVHTCPFGLRIGVSGRVLGPTRKWRVINGLFSVISEAQGATIGRRWFVIRWHWSGGAFVFVRGWVGV